MEGALWVLKWALLHSLLKCGGHGPSGTPVPTSLAKSCDVEILYGIASSKVEFLVYNINQS